MRVAARKASTSPDRLTVIHRLAGPPCVPKSPARALSTSIRTKGFIRSDRHWRPPEAPAEGADIVHPWPVKAAPRPPVPTLLRRRVGSRTGSSEPGGSWWASMPAWSPASTPSSRRPTRSRCATTKCWCSSPAHGRAGGAAVCFPERADPAPRRHGPRRPGQTPGVPLRPAGHLGGDERGRLGRPREGRADPRGRRPALRVRTGGPGPDGAADLGSERHALGARDDERRPRRRPDRPRTSPVPTHRPPARPTHPTDEAWSPLSGAATQARIR